MTLREAVSTAEVVVAAAAAAAAAALQKNTPETQKQATQTTAPPKKDQSLKRKARALALPKAKTKRNTRANALKVVLVDDTNTLAEAIKKIQDPTLKQVLSGVLRKYKEDGFTTTPNKEQQQQQHTGGLKASPLDSILVDLNNKAGDFTTGTTDIASVPATTTMAAATSIDAVAATAAVAVANTPMPPPMTPMITKNTKIKQEDLIPLDENTFAFKKDGITRRSDGISGSSFAAKKASFQSCKKNYRCYS